MIPLALLTFTNATQLGTDSHNSHFVTEEPGIVTTDSTDTGEIQAFNERVCCA